MASKNLYQRIQEAKRRGDKQFVVLIDPDKAGSAQIEATVDLAEKAGVDFFFFGGSLVVDHQAFEDRLQFIRSLTDIPVVLFPGSTYQLSEAADGVLYLSLISGRNPELLIGQQVLAAPFLRASNLEVLPTGYLLIDGGTPTTASYMSNTTPIPADKPDIAACTAMAGEMLGLRLIYLDAGSGAQRPVSPAMIQAVSRVIETPLIVGGGIRKPETALAAVRAGADIIVTGNALEKDPFLMSDLAAAVHAFTY